MQERTYQNIVEGDTVIFHDLRPSDYWNTFEALEQEHFVGQQTLDLGIEPFTGGLLVHSLHPVEKDSPEDHHLSRVVALKQNVSFIL